MVSDHFGSFSGAITNETRFNDLDADVLNMIEMAMILEDEFSARIPDEDIYRMETVRDVIEYLDAIVAKVW